MSERKSKSKWSLAALIVIGGLGISPVIAQSMPDKAAKPVPNLQYATNGMPPLAESYRKCQYMCDLLIAYCLRKGGESAKPEIINPLRDCSDISQLCSSLVSRHSELARRSCALCSDACVVVKAALTEELSEDGYVQNCLSDIDQCETMWRKWSQVPVHK